MKQKTLLLFQLLLAVYALYAVIIYKGNPQFLAPVLCLLAMFAIGKLESIVSEQNRQKHDKWGEAHREDGGKQAFKPLECLLKSKNTLLLSDAIHYILKDLGFLVSRSPNEGAVDRLVRIPDSEVTLGLKILGDVTELNEGWDKWEGLADFDQGKGGLRRLLLIGSNATPVKGTTKLQFKDFPADTQDFLHSKNLVAMTTLTLYKIYLICRKKNVEPKVILNHIQHHPGGVFRLEKYVKGSTKAA